MRDKHFKSPLSGPEKSVLKTRVFKEGAYIEVNLQTFLVVVIRKSGAYNRRFEGDAYNGSRL
jgi:hypothetical protein